MENPARRWPPSQSRAWFWRRCIRRHRRSRHPMRKTTGPTRTVEGWAKMPEGRTWGSTSSVDIDKDGVSIWVGERCGTNSCLTSTLDPVLKFDGNGKLVKSFGAGLVIFPHGITVDRDGNVWIVDGQDNAPRPARGAAPAPAGGTAAPLPMGPTPGATKGHQVIKFSPDGKVLLTLG